MHGVMKHEAFKQLQENTVDIYLADYDGETEKSKQLRAWRLEFCDNPENYVSKQGATFKNNAQP